MSFRVAIIGRFTIRMRNENGEKKNSKRRPRQSRLFYFVGDKRLHRHNPLAYDPFNVQVTMKILCC